MDEKINVYDHLDEFDHFLIWQLDEIIFVIFGFMLGIMFRQPFWGFILGYCIRSAYIRIRDGRPHGYIIHRTRELGFIPSKVDKGTSHQPALTEEYKQ